MKKRRITRVTLDELEKIMPVLSETEQYSIVGGGDGSAGNPYTVMEFEGMCESGSWRGGYVEGWGYTYQDIVVTENADGGTFDWVGVGLDISGNIGSGAQDILDDRGKYMAEGQIYKLRTPITVKIPIGTVDTTARVLNVARVGGKLLGIVGAFFTGVDILHDVGSGNYADATGKTVIAMAQYGFAFIPGYGWAISLGIGVVGQMIYD